ncbi:hypothetical protein [Sandaracinus amylolyticus]|uniref:hypothetical protein n=1 Tax=Sandaracinus amylolyticus TaxID=927083 RepID=UPI001F43DDF4|nr:hypothetical protein [Sandaracinus amylolyticus]UJR85423.1 Hypothetical protein I5071_75030 [Sandaracinus amylolyticus]
MARMRWGLAMVVIATVSACGARSPYRVLPRNVRESVQRDFPDCRGRDVRGLDLGGSRYQVVACGLDLVYACAADRRRDCQIEGTGVVAVSGGGEVPAAYAQPQPQPMPVLQTTPTPTAQPTTTTPSREQVEQVIRAWLDTQRGAILGCTQTQAALVEVQWTAEGTPTIALGGEMHGSPGETCVVQHLAGVQFQNVGAAGELRHVIQ